MSPRDHLAGPDGAAAAGAAALRRPHLGDGVPELRGPAAAAAALLLGCASYPRAPLQSSIDLLYQWRRASTAPAPQPPNATVSAYRSALRSTVSGHCTLLPSESALAQWRFSRCNTATTVVASMARWYLEPDAAQLGLPQTVIGGQVLFSQLPPTCWPLER